MLSTDLLARCAPRASWDAHAELATHDLARADATGATGANSPRGRRSARVGGHVGRLRRLLGFAPFGLLLATAVILTTLSSGALERAVAADLRPGFAPRVFALEHARIVVEPGTVIDPGTLVMRSGVIEAVGPDGEVNVPFDAERIDGRGLVAYPGLVNAFSTTGIDSSAPRSQTGSGRAVDYGSFALGATPPDNRSGLSPEFLASEALVLDDAAVKPWREVGFTSALVAPGGGVVAGQSALVSLSGQPRREILLASPVAMHVALVPPGARGYPSTLMGVIAHLRQAMLDSAHHEALWEHFRVHGGPRPPVDPALEALGAIRSGQLRVFWEANLRDDIHRALDLSEELGVRPVIVGGSEAWRVVDRLREENVPVVLRIDFPDEPKSGYAQGSRNEITDIVESLPLERLQEALARTDLPAEYRARIEQRVAELKGETPTAEAKPAESGARRLPESPRLLAEQKRIWNELVACAARLSEAGVPFCLSAAGHSKAEKFFEHLRQAIGQGLQADAALAAMTRDAAAILGVDAQLGRIAPGMADHVVVMSGPLEEAKSKVRYVFVDAAKFELNAPPAAAARADGAGRAAERAGRRPAVRPSAEEAPADAPGDQPNDLAPEDEPNASPAAEEPAAPESPARDKDKDADAETSEQPAGARGSEADAAPAAPAAPAAAQPADAAEAGGSALAALSTAAEPFPTEIRADRFPQRQTGGNVLVRGATVLTLTGGTLAETDVLVEEGRIAAIGRALSAPEGVEVIEAEGLYLMPGIIDTHVHFAISRGINEASLSVVPECRIKDVITGDDVGIFLSLAGGVTTARVLHGSANPIGGQDAVIKLRWGRPGRELLLDEGPQGVKFALGENPKRSRSRYPDTRLGVESSIRRSFDEGRMYARLWQTYEAARARGETPPPPRRDLRLEALAAMLDGSIQIHSHCYRADEILMLLRLAESYGIRIRSLQHALEGYKVAPEIAAHGASVSSFSDWWAYKVEAFDAIPYNAALLTEAGAMVAIKSDDRELVRHMYQEAAKTVKYGNLSEAQALATITINAATQLGLDHRIGSIEVGKDADLALFNGHPLNGFARCVLTLVDGEIYFERAGDLVPSGYGWPVAEESIRARTLAVPESPAGSYFLRGARIETVSGAAIERGTLWIREGRIEALGGPDLPVPEGAVTVDLDGLMIFPGMINAGTNLGLTEVRSLSETQDFAEAGPYNADIRASVAIHPDSELIPVSRANGVLAVLTRPSGGVISGQSVLLNLWGWIPPEMAVRDPAALHVNLPTGSLDPDGGERRKRAAEAIDALKQQFRLALRYDELVRRATEAGGALPVPDPQLAALAPYARGEGLVMIHADAQADILAAIDLAAELKLHWALADAAEAWRCAKELKEADVPVVVGPVMQLPRSGNSPYDSAYSNARLLHEAGVRVAIKAEDSGPGDATSTRNLPYHAAMAVAYGLPPEEGLRAVTLTAAQILGVGDQLGSIEVGKLANLVVTDGHLLQPTTQVKLLFVAGQPLDTSSRHTRLYARYRERLDQVQSGRVMLGVGAPATERPAPTADSAPEPAGGAGQ